MRHVKRAAVLKRATVLGGVGLLCLASPIHAEIAADAQAQTIASSPSGQALSRAELTQLFEIFDSNGNGAITKPELRDVIVSFRVDLSDGELTKMVETYDTSADGILQLDEFAKLMQGFRGEDASVEAQMERTFLRFDANRDGGLDAREVRALVEANGQVITLREAKTIIFEADVDGNGRIDTSEFNKPAG